MKVRRMAADLGGRRIAIVVRMDQRREQVLRHTTVVKGRPASGARGLAKHSSLKAR